MIVNIRLNKFILLWNSIYSFLLLLALPQMLASIYFIKHSKRLIFFSLQNVIREVGFFNHRKILLILTSNIFLLHLKPAQANKINNLVIFPLILWQARMQFLVLLLLYSASEDLPKVTQKYQVLGKASIHRIQY